MIEKTPQLEPKIMKLSVEYVNSLLGLNLEPQEIKVLLERMRYKAVVKDSKTLEVWIPAYRCDILHQIDLVEDIAIAYNYKNFKPEIPEIFTIGSMRKEEMFHSKLRELMLGFGFQEVKTLVMTNTTLLFKRMNIPEEEVVKAENPVSLEHGVARNWLLPSLMSVLEKNKNREYPQRIFEIGDCIKANGKDFKKLCCVIASSKTNFAEIKSILFGLLDSLNFDLSSIKLKPYDHGSFIAGRCASMKYGFFGEISPEVLENFSIEMPVTAMELDLEKVFADVKKENLKD